MTSTQTSVSPEIAQKNQRIAQETYEQMKREEALFLGGAGAEEYRIWHSRLMSEARRRIADLEWKPEIVLRGLEEEDSLASLRSLVAMLRIIEATNQGETLKAVISRT